MSKHYVAMDAPTIHHSRSRFDLSYDIKTSMSVGKLYPIYLQEVYPGDTFSDSTTLVTRLSSAYIRPVMDNLFMDVYFFFVPNRIVFDKWEQVFGENKAGVWVQPAPVSAPVFPQYQQVYEGTVADYLGLPVSDAVAGEYLPKGVNILPFRAFAKIYDDWFRDQNMIAPMLIQTGDYTIAEYLNNSDWAPGNYMGKLPSVSKFHDIFTSALPSTQKAAAPVKVPLGGTVPVVAGASHLFGGKIQMEPAATFTSPLALRVDSTIAAGTYGRLAYVTSSGSQTVPSDWSVNMVADLENAGQFNVTDLRYAFQLQRILERAARTGTRYTEYLMGAFGVSSPDARLQRAEYLGGKRMPLSVQQVAQTTPGSSGGDTLGTLGAFSLSNGKCGFQKGFVEHGFIIGVCCIRQHHTYQQGVERMWQRHARFDYYDPILANISEVPVYRSELYAATNPVSDDALDADVFGYQEAWYDLRQRKSQVTGQMRTINSASFDIYHYADFYANAPYLNKQFITEIPDYVDRTIAVPSTSADQFIVDIYHKQTAIRVLPTYSIPGLVDHH